MNVHHEVSHSSELSFFDGLGEDVSELIGTSSMIADLFTKALEKGQFFKLRDVMMNHHAPLRDALSVAMCQMHGSASRLAQRLSRQL